MKTICCDKCRLPVRPMLVYFFASFYKVTSLAFLLGPKIASCFIQTFLFADEIDCDVTIQPLFVTLPNQLVNSSPVVSVFQQLLHIYIKKQVWILKFSLFLVSRQKLFVFRWPTCYKNRFQLFQQICVCAAITVTHKTTCSHFYLVLCFLIASVHCMSCNQKPETGHNRNATKGPISCQRGEHKSTCLLTETLTLATTVKVLEVEPFSRLRSVQRANYSGRQGIGARQRIRAVSQDERGLQVRVSLHFSARTKRCFWRDLLVGRMKEKPAAHESLWPATLNCSATAVMALFTSEATMCVIFVWNHVLKASSARFAHTAPYAYRLSVRTHVFVDMEPLQVIRQVRVETISNPTVTAL